MGTSCNIGIRLPDGSIEGTYVSFDGYPDHMVPQVCWFLRDHTTSCLLLEIRRAQAVGGFHCWHPISTEPGFAGTHLNSDLRQDEEERYGVDDFGSGVPYTYLVDFETGELQARERLYNGSDRWKSVPIEPADHPHTGRRRRLSASRPHDQMSQ